MIGSDISLAWIQPEDDRYDGAQLIDGTFGFLPRGDVRPEPAGGLPRQLMCRSEPCASGGASGSCTGVRFCYAGRLGPCVITRGPTGTGSAETCDGLDNDCDTRVDENPTAICNDGIGCTVDLCAFGTCSNVPRASACGTALGPDGTQCTTDVCTNGDGETNSRVLVSATDIALATPTPGHPGCSVAVGHSWCTNTWDSCGCNGPEQCFPGSGTPANPSGCGPVAGSTPASQTPCDPGSFCAVEALCCEADSSFCRLDATIAAMPNGPSILAQRNDACRLPGGGPSLTAAAPTIGIGALPVQCSPRSPVAIPNCVDMNPCTADRCSETNGCLPSLPAPNGSRRAAESFGFGIEGLDCNAEFIAGCADSMCDGAGTCVADPSSFDDYPAGSNSEVCFSEYTEDLCGRWQCNGAGVCGIRQTEGLAPGDTTLECGFRPRDAPPDTDCFHDGCVNGRCTADIADSRLCPQPQGCSAPFVCSGRVSLNDTDVLAGCAPVNECYVGGTRNGVLDGTCVPIGGLPSSCVFCNPTNAPFRFTNRPLGTPCPDANACTINETCDTTGTCVSDCRPECEQEFCGAGL